MRKILEFTVNFIVQVVFVIIGIIAIPFWIGRKSADWWLKNEDGSPVTSNLISSNQQDELLFNIEAMQKINNRTMSMYWN